MSILIEGLKEDVNIVYNLLGHYNEIKNKNIIDYNIDIIENDSNQIELKTKYYTANIPLKYSIINNDINLNDLNNDFDFVQAYINIIPSIDYNNYIDFIRSSKSIRIIEENDINNRIMIQLIRSDLDEDDLNNIKLENINWCLDNGFEFIAINLNRLTEGWEEREKDDLPRLIEALENNIWTTQNTNSSITIQITDTQIIESKADAFETITNHSLNDESTNNNIEEFGEFESEEYLDNFSSLLEQVKFARELALNGQVNDAERKERAADIALKLSQLLMLDDSDNDDDD